MGNPICRAFAGVALVVSCLTVAPSIAWADESAAETLFQEGLAAMKKNDFTTACEAFAGSNKADPSPGTQINLALCYEKQKKWASAWTWYRSAVGLAQQRNQAERERLADESANRVKPLIHYLVISVKEPLSDMVVKRDNAEVTIAVGGREVPLAIDPGEHTIEVTARGKKPWSKTVVMAENNQTDRVDVPKLENAPVDEKAPPPPAGGNGDARTPLVVGNDGSGQRTTGIIVGGAGLLAGLVGVGVFVLGKGQESEGKDEREQAAQFPEGSPDKIRFDTAAKSSFDAAKNDQLIALVCGGGAVVLVGVGAVLYFTAPKASAEKAAKSTKPSVTPSLGPGFAGLGLSGTF